MGQAEYCFKYALIFAGHSTAISVYNAPLAVTFLSRKETTYFGGTSFGKIYDEQYGVRGITCNLIVIGIFEKNSKVYWSAVSTTKRQLQPIGRRNDTKQA